MVYIRLARRALPAQRVLGIRCASSTDALFDVAGKSVVITGGAQGIGRALAEGFAKRGCNLYLLDFRAEDVERTAAEIEAEHGCTARGFGCNVQDEAQVQQAAAAVSAVDVLINCAGVTRRGAAEEFPLEEFDRIQATNVRGSWLSSIAFGSRMLDRGGSIINIDSFVTASVLKHVLPYAVSKAGVQAMTKGLALEWGPRGVRVNGLAPGLILTPISSAMWSQPHMAAWAKEETPMGRMGASEDLVGAAVFLASPAAKFISGQTLRVDGGLSAGRHWPIEQSAPAAPAASGKRSFSTASSAVQRRQAPLVRTDMFYKGGDFVTNPFEGDGVAVNSAAGAVQASKHRVLNGRFDPELRGPVALEKRGLCLIDHQSAVTDFHSQQELDDLYHAELVAEAKRLTGADAAIVASVGHRHVAADAEKDAPSGARPAAFMVHGDFSDSLKDKMVESIREGRPCIVGDAGLGLSAEELDQGRLVVLNFWRPTGEEPLQRAPLAVLDATSMQPEDMEVYAHDPQPPPQNYLLPLPNLLTVATSSERHRWYGFPGMTRDECMVFKTYDSAGCQPSNGVGVHSAFNDPTMDAHAPARDSVEARVVCFLKPEQGAKWERGAAELAERPPMENVERLAFYRWLQDDEWTGAVGLTAKFTIETAKVPIYLDIMKENIAGTRKEPGMLQYDLVPDYAPGNAGEGQTVFFLLERFRTRGDLLTHVQSEHYKRCQERFGSDMGGHPLVQITLYRIDPVEP